MVFDQGQVAVRSPMMTTSNGTSDSLSVDINPKLLLINGNDNAPLAKQESLTDILRNEVTHEVHVNGDNHNDIVDDELEEELRHVVVVRENPAADIGVTASGSSRSFQSSQDPTISVSRPKQNHKIVDDSPINEPIVIVRHKAQVLQGPVDDSVLEKLLESDGSESNIDSSRSKLQTEEPEDRVDFVDKKVKYSSAKKVSQDLIISLDNIPDEDLKVTDKLPEVLLVAEQLPERLRNGKNILVRSPTREKDPSAPQYESSEMDDGGSTLTIGRTDTIQEVHEVLQIEPDPAEPPKKVINVVKKGPEAVPHEASCISPFFVGVYFSLGALIVIMIGLNFWFGFHLLFFVGLLAVIALFACILTEFNDFHNEPD